VTNAVKHAFPDERRGTIKVTVESPEDDQIELRVADDGVGLPESVANGQSEGYGLAIVTGFVEQIGGSLDMSAGDTGGTVLSIRFSPSDAG
jgi:two-component sensor histidine kinase